MEKPTQQPLKFKLGEMAHILLRTTLIGAMVGAGIGLTLGGVTAVLAQLVTGIGSVALRAALGGALICALVGLLAGVSICLDKANNRFGG